MLGDRFRPWGLLPWVLEHLTPHVWGLLGSLSAEKRCLTAWSLLKERGELGGVHFMDVQDEPSMYTERADGLRRERREEFRSLGGDLTEVHDHRLFERHEEIVRAVDSFAATAGENLLLDISCFPKRFFFPAMRRLMQAESLRNVVVTYTLPKQYTMGPLAVDPEPYRHIPLFMPPYPEPKQEDRLLVVATGYEPLGLPQLLESGDFLRSAVRLLFPCPSPPPSYEKNWRFVHQLEPNEESSRYELIFVNKLDVSEVFDRIRALTDSGQRYAVFAPYGPKPVSLAMCLYAVSTCGQQGGAAVYYTQPKAYNPDYSSGVEQVDGGPAVYAYCVRLDGVDLY